MIQELAEKLDLMELFFAYCQGVEKGELMLQAAAGPWTGHLETVAANCQYAHFSQKDWVMPGVKY